MYFKFSLSLKKNSMQYYCSVSYESIGFYFYVNKMLRNSFFVSKNVPNLFSLESNFPLLRHLNEMLGEIHSNLIIGKRPTWLKWLIDAHRYKHVLVLIFYLNFLLFNRKPFWVTRNIWSLWWKLIKINYFVVFYVHSLFSLRI